MVSKLGIYAMLTGIFAGLFTGISNFMGADNFWVGLSISKIIGEAASESIGGTMNVAFVRNSLDFLLYELPFFLFLIGIGVVFLIISLFLKKFKHYMHANV